MDRRKSAGKFDVNKPLLSSKAQTCYGKNLKPGDPIPSEVGHGIRRRMWMTNRAHYGEEQKKAAPKTPKAPAPKQPAPKTKTVTKPTVQKTSKPPAKKDDET